MENYAYFYNSNNGDRVYDADSMTDWLLPFFKTGVFNGQMQVTANDDMTVTVETGYCNIKGKTKPFRQRTTFDLEVASGTLNRIDNVILRRDDTLRDIYLMIEKGGNAQVPAAPPLVRSGAIYDLKLAEIYIEAGTIRITQEQITDTRMNANVCGWVASTVSEISFEQVTQQFEAFFARYQRQIAHDYAAYLQALGIEEDKAEAAYQNFLAIMDGYTQQQQAIFEAWFEQVRGQLEEDPAGHLQNEIDALKPHLDNLAFKIAIDYQLEAVQPITVTLNNETSGSRYEKTLSGSEVAFKITEPGHYSVAFSKDDVLAVPRQFDVDHNRVMTTMQITIRDGNRAGFIGSYLGSYITQ